MKYFEIAMHEHLEKVVEEGGGVVVNASASSILWRKKIKETYFAAISRDLATQTCLQPLTR